MKRLLLLLFVIVLSSQASAQALGACTNNLADAVRTDAGAYIGGVIGLMVIIIALMYAAGSAWSNASLVVIAKDELYHLLFSVVLLGAIGGVFWFSCVSFDTFLDFALRQAGASACYTGVESPQAVALCYTGNMEREARSFVTNTVKQSINNEMDSTLVVSFMNPITGGVYLPFTAYKRTFSQQFEMVGSQFAMPALVSLGMQKVFLGFSNDVVRWLLPIAIFLRIIPPMRQMGNMLVAVSVAFFIVVPVFYALNGAMDEIVSKDCSQYQSITYVEPMHIPMCEGLVCDQVMGDCDSPTSFWLAARFIPQAFFLPNLTLALLVTFLAGANKALKVIG